MKILTIAIIALAPGFARGQDGDDAKKKRLGEIIQTMNKIQKEARQLLQELSNGDPEKAQAIMEELMGKYAPEMAAEPGRAVLAANERTASFSLKTLASAQADFRSNDRDGNRVNDFWVADVSGLYRIDAGEGAIRLIELSVATADAKPCLPLDQEGRLARAAKEHASKLLAIGKPVPKAGYWFSVIEKYEDDKGAAVKYDDGNGRCSSAFGVCAYPAEYGKSGKMTFILSEENTVWMKDTGGKVPEVFPANPAKAGWTRLG